MAPRIILSLLGKYNFPHAYHHSLAYMELSNDPRRPKAVHLFKFMFYWCAQRELRPGKVNQSFFFFFSPDCLSASEDLGLVILLSQHSIPVVSLSLPFPLLSPLEPSHCSFSHSYVVVVFSTFIWPVHLAPLFTAWHMQSLDWVKMPPLL